MKLSLVILAAGMGRRYGGLKQLEPVGPGGATIMDYSIYDARRAGFSDFVFVIRPDMQAAFDGYLAERYRGRIRAVCVHQTLEALPEGFRVPAGRSKPWGTAHALLMAQPAVSGPFAVANADDFYGQAAFAELAAFLSGPAPADSQVHALVGYALGQTLPLRGAVSRAICRCSDDWWVEEIVETHGLERSDGGAVCVDQRGVRQDFQADQLVSMNLWGFRPGIFEVIGPAFREFLRANAESADAEFYLPTAVNDAIRSGRARVRVLRTSERWCGVTHPEDKVFVSKYLFELVSSGRYPECLWS
jgi:NDP-sugar pyrophosphorylase family protein